MIVGSVPADIFEATMKNFLTHCCSDGNPRAFVMDNARIHDPSLDDYVKQSTMIFSSMLLTLPK